MLKIKHFKGFSLAEMMVVMLIMTIILAASMPILSKRAKVKAAAAASGGGSGQALYLYGSANNVPDSSWSVTGPDGTYNMKLCTTEGASEPNGFGGVCHIVNNIDPSYARAYIRSGTWYNNRIYNC